MSSLGIGFYYVILDQIVCAIKSWQMRCCLSHVWFVYDCKGCTNFGCRWLKVWFGEDTESVLDVLMLLVVYILVGFKGMHLSKARWMEKEKVREQFLHLPID